MDLLAFLRDLHAKGVDLFLHQQGLDTSIPSGRAMFLMLGVFAEFAWAGPARAAPLPSKRINNGFEKRPALIDVGRRSAADYFNLANSV